MKTLSVILVLTAVVAAAHALVECDPAAPCNDDCLADPECACSGEEPDVDISERPMILYLTFDDALTELHHTEYFGQIFDGAYNNPNGCPIRGTFFLTHQSNDYTLTNLYYSQGHEIASHSVTHKNDQDYWKELDVEGWRAEITAMRQMTAKYGLVPEEAIIGTRAPFLEVGGEEQFTMMVEDGFKYDGSMPSLAYGYTNMENGRWPHTLDYASTMDCVIQPCPKCSYPGIWSQPILDLEDQWLGSDGVNASIGAPCSMLDSCDFDPDGPETADEAYNMLMKNFERAYNGKTRAPLGFYVHAAWFTGTELEWRFEGLRRFIEEVIDYGDVWIVPVQQGIEYMKNPVPNDDLIFESDVFGCFDLPEFTCDAPRDCRYTDVDLEGLQIPEIFMPSCTTCPPNYPWIGNPDGN